MKSFQQEIDHLPTPYVLFGVGVPGSGKTTGLEQIESDLQIKRVCPDDIRAHLTGDANNQSKNEEAWNTARTDIRHELEEGHSVILDAASTNAERRARDIQLYRTFGARAIAAIVFDVPLERAKERNLDPRRGRIVPEPVIERMYHALQTAPPTPEEGFDAVLHYPQSK